LHKSVFKHYKKRRKINIRAIAVQYRRATNKGNSNFILKPGEMKSDEAIVF